MSAEATRAASELEADVMAALEREALAAELTPDELEDAARLVLGGDDPETAVLAVIEGREEEDERQEPEQPAGEQPPTPEELEAIFSRLEKQATKHREKVLELAGPLAADLAPCPLCQEQAPGFYLHTLPPEQAQARAHTVAAELLGGVVPEYHEAETVEQCDKCGGWGQVLSGSLMPEHRTVPCQGCGGTGHKPKVTAPAPPAPLPEGAASPLVVPTGDGAGGQPDTWGRPAGHPHYGIHPAQVPA